MTDKIQTQAIDTEDAPNLGSVTSGDSVLVHSGTDKYLHKVPSDEFYTKGNKPTAADVGALTQDVADARYRKISDGEVYPTISITKNLQPTADTWMTLLENADFPSSGVYQIHLHFSTYASGGRVYAQHYTGQFYWYKEDTNDIDVSEILLHHMGHASNKKFYYLRTRTVQRGTGSQVLEMHGDETLTSPASFIVQIKRIM